MKYIIIALSGIALILNASPAFARLWQIDLDNVKWDRGCDFNGRDIQCKYGVTNCANMCMNNAECTHYTSQGDRCCIKKSDFFYETDTFDHDQICGFIPWRSNQP